MKTNVKLLGGVTLAAAMLVGCTGEGLPPGTGNPSQPGFHGSVTKGGAPVKGAKVWLKKYSGAEGSLAGGTAVDNTVVETDSQGLYFIPAPADAVTGGALFGVGYDKTKYDQGADNISAATLKDEIQWFSSPAVNLSNKNGQRHNVSFDIAWNTDAFTPANGGTVAGPNVTFTLPEKPGGATKYEIQVNQGTVAGSGTKVFGPAAQAGRTFTWTGAAAGQYTYQAKAHVPAGIAGISGDATSQAASPWLLFTVTGAQ